MRAILTVLALVLTTAVNAQAPYQCLLPGQRQYFSNERHYLRGMRIDSVRTTGGATIFYPFHARRLRNGHLVDSTGGSWLGKELRSFPGGRSEIQTYWNDTVVIETLAGMGQRWVFYSDTSALYYVAQVTAIDSATIDGAMDSVKTIQLTAMRGGSTDAGNPVNSYRIVLSRAHGFREIFDLYTFPYTKPGGQRYPNGSFDYFLQVNPFDKPEYSVFRPIAYRNPLYSELYDLQPGDIFQRSRWKQEVSLSGYTESVRVQDSIATRRRVTGGIEYTASVRSSYSKTYDAPGSSPVSGMGGPVPLTHFYPDLPVSILDTQRMPEEWGPRMVYYYDPADTTNCVTSALYRRSGYNFPIPLDGPPLESVTYKAGFGLQDSTGGYRFGPMNEFFVYLRQGLSARKSGVDCGAFLPLSVGGTAPAAALRVYPNPVRDRLSVDIPETTGELSLCISDLSGRRVMERMVRSGRIEISTTGLSNGIYLLRLDGGSVPQILRLVVAH